MRFEQYFEQLVRVVIATMWIDTMTWRLENPTGYVTQIVIGFSIQPFLIDTAY